MQYLNGVKKKKHKGLALRCTWTPERHCEPRGSMKRWVWLRTCNWGLTPGVSAVIGWQIIAWRWEKHKPCKHVKLHSSLKGRRCPSVDEYEMHVHDKSTHAHLGNDTHALSHASVIHKQHLLCFWYDWERRKAYKQNQNRWLHANQRGPHPTIHPAVTMPLESIAILALQRNLPSLWEE